MKTVKWLVIIAIVIGIGYIIFREKPVPTPIQVIDYSPKKAVIGKSVENRSIESYTFGNGQKHITFVGGIHGGYEWNSVLLAYELIDYITSSTTTVPENVTLTIIPSLNPDGLFKVIGKEGRFTIAEAIAKDPKDGTGRFNANNVDLNRNFDCKWQPESTWRSKKVSAGTFSFSEPEAIAIKDFVASTSPEAMIFLHSQANAVYASECLNGILPETREIMDIYSKASGYKAVDSFDAYPVTGDVEGWLASIGIPSLSVELATHETVEFEKNLAGLKAILEYYRSK